MKRSAPTSTARPATRAETPKPGTASKLPSTEATGRASRPPRRWPGRSDARSGSPRPRRAAARRFRETLGGDEVGQLRPPERQRAGLVEGDDLDFLQALQRLAAAEQDAELGGAAGADHDRGRRGKPHGAGAGDDQHRHRVDQREGQRRLGPKTSQTRKVSAAAAITAGTNHAVTRSTRAWIGSLEPWASSTMRTIWASSVSAPTPWRGR